jgi:hypothetical protein
MVYSAIPYIEKSWLRLCVGEEDKIMTKIHSKSSIFNVLCNRIRHLQGTFLAPHPRGWTSPRRVKPRTPGKSNTGAEVMQAQHASVHAAE